MDCIEWIYWGREGKLSKEKFSLPSPNPIPPFPKTFMLIESLISAFPYGFTQGKAVFLIR